jgi:hypothetical protein
MAKMYADLLLYTDEISFYIRLVFRVHISHSESKLDAELSKMRRI